MPGIITRSEVVVPGVRMRAMLTLDPLSVFMVTFFVEVLVVESFRILVCNELVGTIPVSSI